MQGNNGREYKRHSDMVEAAEKLYFDDESDRTTASAATSSTDVVQVKQRRRQWDILQEIRDMQTDNHH